MTETRTTYTTDARDTAHTRAQAAHYALVAGDTERKMIPVEVVGRWLDRILDAPDPQAAVAQADSEPCDGFDDMLANEDDRLSQMRIDPMYAVIPEQRSGPIRTQMARHALADANTRGVRIPPDIVDNWLGYILAAPTENVQTLVRLRASAWAERSQWVRPDLADCLDFAATEIAEAIDLRLRRTAYVRNSEEGVPSNHDIATELFDVVMMCCVGLDLLGCDLLDVAREKLKKMDERRLGSE